MNLLMNMIRIFFLVFLTGIVSMLNVRGESTTQRDSKRVVFVSSYHPEQVWSRRVLRAVNMQFKKTGYDIDMRVIYLDAKRIEDINVRRSLLETNLLEIKGKVDLIIVSDEEAYESFFLLDIPLLKDIPILFCGVEHHEPKVGFDRVTGVICDVDYEKVFLLGRKLFPGAERVYVFSDRTGAGRIHENLARLQLAKYTGVFPVFFGSDSLLKVDHFLDTLRNIHPASFVILTTWQRGVQNIYLDPDIYYVMFANECPVPIFTALDSGLGKGFFGGIIAFANQQGVLVGQMAVRILNGEKIESIPIDTARPVPVFDDRQLKRWHVTRSVLPAERIILNDPNTFWSLYKNYILGVSVGVVVLVILIFLLIVYQLRYRKMLQRSTSLEKSAHQMAVMLGEKTEILSNTLSSMSEGIIVVDRGLRVIELNHASMQVLGCDQNAVGTSLCDICEINRNKDVLGIEEFVHEVMNKSKRKGLAVDTVLVPRHAPVQQVAGSVFPLLNSAGEVNGAVMMFRNITKEWQQQRFLRISMAALRAYSWFYDVEKDVLVLSESFTGLEIINKKFDGLEVFANCVHPDDRELFLGFMQRILQDGPREFSLVFRMDYLHAGQYQWWESRGVVETVEMTDGRRVKYLYGMDIDISIHKQVEENMAEAMRRAEESDKLKTAFLANISHEIRTPLNGIVGFANLICEPGYSEEEKALFRDTVTSNSRVLLGLLDDVLDLSRIEAGTETVNLDVCDMHFLVYSVLDIGQLNVPEGIELVVRGPEQELLVLTDESKLTKVFLGLIRNAKKFTTQGYIAAGAWVTDDGGWIECCVADTGIGISADHVKHIFKRFYKVNEFKQGTGLGLPICKALVELLGGTMWVESEYGKGTTFYFRIPYRIP